MTAKILVGAMLLGIIGGVGSTMVGQSPSTTSDSVDSGFKRRNTINRQPLMSAADLDKQQPNTPGPAQASPRRQAASSASAGSGWSYRNCREARAAGVAPLYRGQPGYGSHMDGDNDGIACEPYHGR